MLPSFAAQGFQKGNQVLLILLSQVQRLDPLVELGVLDAPLVVMLDYLFQRLQAAVVHVGSGTRDVAQRRRLEGALVRLELRDGEAPEVGLLLVHADAEVVVALVGEVEADVTRLAAGLALEEREPAPRGGGQRAGLAGAVLPADAWPPLQNGLAPK